MQLIEESLKPEIDYRELFTVEVDENKCTDDIIGIKNDGEIIFIKEKMSNSGNAYWMNRVFYSIDRDELHQYIEIAKSNGEIEKAIKNKRTTMEEINLL